MLSLKPQKYSALIKRMVNYPPIILGIASVVLCSSVASAGTLGEINSVREHQHLIILSGGAANVHVGQSQSYLGTDNDRFAYYNKGSNKTTGLVGVFLGEEFSQLNINPALLFQAGLEYTYLGNNHLQGTNTVGIQPNTSTLYRYNYTFESQQLLAVAKVLATTHQIFHPYVFAGIGAAFNQSGNYNAYTSESGSINLTPTFHSNTQTKFSYALGVGVDTNVNKHVRLGLGYRFTDMGEASLGKGQVVANNYAFPTGFTLRMPHVYANQIIAQLSYLA